MQVPTMVQGRASRRAGAPLRAAGAALVAIWALSALLTASSTGYAVPRQPGRRDGLLAAASGLAGVAAAGPARAANHPVATLQVDVEGADGPATEAVQIQLRPDWAPRGVKRFLEMVEMGDMSDSALYHVDKDSVVKFGHPAEPTLPYDVIKDDSVRASNTRGRVSFSGLVGSKRRNELFVNYVDNSHLDRKGASPIGEVLGDGMEVLDRLYDGYGISPSKPLVVEYGNEYLDKGFPKLPKIKSVSISS